MKFSFVAFAFIMVTASSVQAEDVNVYSYRQPELIKPLTDEFTAQTGINVNVAYLQKGMVERMKAEGREFISTASASTISSLLTLFPKCFSSFLHSTCSLSVFEMYLALEEVYLPLSALVSEYTTLGKPGR